jgi:catechol 2,3-dioxygenase-like lactoylglutathione lyase family enzyme
VNTTIAATTTTATESPAASTVPAVTSRVQLALNVSDLEASVAFYTAMFGVEPHKRRPGYANFAIAEPPLKLVLIETSEDVRGTGTVGALNHLGVEVSSTDDVTAARTRFSDAGLAAFDENDTTCCYALQDKVWVHDPAGAPWEVYTVKDENPAQPRDAFDQPTGIAGDGACCTSNAGTQAQPREESAALPLAGTPKAQACCS